MQKRLSTLILFVVLSTVLVITGCGVKGNPRVSPKVEIPAVSDLQAYVTSTKVHLRWTPSLTYTDGSELNISTVEIYRLDEELTQRLEQFRDDTKKRQAEIERQDRTIPQQLLNNDSLGPLASRLKTISRLRVENFSESATLVATIPVEQLLENAIRGKLNWSLTHNLNMSNELPDSRQVYAVRQVDNKGKASAFSNAIAIYPFYSAIAPNSTTGTLDQENFTLTWLSPDFDNTATSEVQLAGYYVYKYRQGEELGVPVAYGLIEPAAPANWSIDSKGGITPANPGITITHNPEGRTFAAQEIISSTAIDSYKGQEIQVFAKVSTVGAKTMAKVIIDFSRTNVGVAQPPANKDIFPDEDEHPLISYRDVEVENTGSSVTFTVEVPSDAVAAQIRIETQSDFNDSHQLTISEVSAEAVSTGENLITNGQFLNFESLSFEEPVVAYGGSFNYAVTALYSGPGYYFESSPGEVYQVTFSDTFAPDAPKNFIGLASRGTISVTWDAVEAEDLAGYNVYRRQLPDGLWELLTENSFRQTILRDNNVEAGTSYQYRVTAVDTRGNESEFSAIAEVSALQE